LLRNPARHHTLNVTNKPKKERTNGNLLHRDKKTGKATAQKQECGCPSLQPSLRSHTHAFLADPLALIEAILVF